MTKINFRKVEESLEEGLRKLKVAELGKIAEASQNVGRPELQALTDKILSSASQKAMERKSAFYVLKQGVNKYTNDDFYAEFNLSHDSLAGLIKKGKELTPEDWEILMRIKAKMLTAKAQEQTAHPELDNENLVRKNRKSQINARINVQKSWLPLDAKSHK